MERWSSVEVLVVFLWRDCWWGGVVGWQVWNCHSLIVLGMLTGVGGEMRVLLALVETGFSLLLLELGIRQGALLVGLVDLGGSDV